MTKTQKYVLIGVAVVVVAGTIYYIGSRAGKKISLPNSGGGIPEGWTPVIPVNILREAMDGVGTNEEQVFNALQGLTNDQLAAVFNEYMNQTGESLTDRFREEFSGDELNRVLYIFKDVL